MVTYALYEFPNKAVDVGPTKWIDQGDSAELDLKTIVEERRQVRVAWPNSRSNKSKKQGAAATVYDAVVLAVDENKSNLIGSRNRICNGQNLETDHERGRGKRKKEPTQKFLTSSSSSESEEESIAERTVKPKKSKSTKSGLQNCSKMASQLRQQLLNTDDTGEILSSDDEEEQTSQTSSHSSERLQTEIRRLKTENDVLKQQFEFLKDIPGLITNVNKFLASQSVRTPAKCMGVDKKSVRNLHVPAEFPASPSSQASSSLSRSTSPSSSISSEDEAMVYLSPSVSLKQSQMMKCNSPDYRKLTGNLLVVLFGRKDLSTYSLTGAANNSGVKKPALCRDKVAALIEFVMKKFPDVSEQQVKAVITNKLSNEAKLYRRKLSVDDAQN